MNDEKMITGRRSVQWFDPEKKLSKEQVDEVLSLASYAPSTFNLQPWEVVCVMSDDMKEKLKDASFSQPKVAEASCVCVIVGNVNAVEENIEAVLRSNIELGYMNEDTADTYRTMIKKKYADDGAKLRFALKNAGLFAMNLMTAAMVKNIDSHPMDGFDAGKVKELLNIDEEKEAVMFVCLGYKRKDKNLNERAVRFAPSEFARYL